MSAAADLLRRLRERGYAVQLAGNRLRVSGPTPARPDASRAALQAHSAGLAALLEAEGHPAARAAVEAFPGARLREVRSTPARPPEPLAAPARGEPTGWRNAGEFRAYLRRLGARIYQDPIGLVCVAPSELFTAHVAAGMRIYRAELLAHTEPVAGEVVEPPGWTWLRV